MKESYEKGVAIRLGPELCAANRKAGCEALVGLRAGRVLSPAITPTGVPRTLYGVQISAGRELLRATSNYVESARLGGA